MRILLPLLLLVAAPASAEVALFSQRDFQGARYGLEAASSNMTFSPRSVRVAETPWELCPRPFFGGTCLRIDKNRSNLSLPRGFSGVVRSARPIDGSKAADKKPKDQTAPPKAEPEKPEDKPQPKD